MSDNADFDIVKINNLVTEREVLAVLNQRPPSSYAYAGFVEAYWKGAIPDAPPHTAAQFCNALREWAERQGQIGGSAFASNYLASAPYFRPPAATPDHGWSLPDTISTKEGQAMGAALTSVHLRALVDAWLETVRDDITGCADVNGGAVNFYNDIAKVFAERNLFLAGLEP